jgi:hypothetical protein
MRDGELQIAKFKFKVTKALLRGNVLPGQFFWTLKVHAKGKVAGFDLEPLAYSENILALRNKAVNRLNDIAGKRLTWSEAYDQESGITQASLYVFSHEDIDESVLEFYRDETGLCLKWRGVAEVSSEEFDDHDEIKFAATAPVTFEGFATIGFSEAQSLDALRCWVTSEEFETPQRLDDDTFLFPVVGN